MIPDTFEEAVDIVVKAVTEYKEREKDPSFKFSVAESHHGYGTGLRNEWGLWHDSKLAQHMKERFGLGHADDMSGLIMEKAESILNGTSFNINEQVRHYESHWRKLGIDPLTQKRLK